MQLVFDLDWQEGLDRDNWLYCLSEIKKATVSLQGN